MMSSREWLALFDTIDDESEGHSVNPVVKPIDMEEDTRVFPAPLWRHKCIEAEAERDQLKARVVELETEVDRLEKLQQGFILMLKDYKKTNHQSEADSLHKMLEAAEKRGFVIQLIPARLYVPPPEA